MQSVNVCSVTVFRDHAEEANKPVRQVVPLDITEEERRAAQMLFPISSMDDDQQTRVDPVSQIHKHAQALTDALATKQQNANAQSSKQAEVMAMIDKIPTDKEGLFAYRVDWDKVAQYNVSSIAVKCSVCLSKVLTVSVQVVEGTLRKWVARKIVDFLGEEEATLIDHIVSQLNGRCAPQDLLNDLVLVLDAEAEPFVLKLWRMLVFSYLKAQA
jgi:RNA-binding protein 25